MRRLLHAATEAIFSTIAFFACCLAVVAVIAILFAIVFGPLILIHKWQLLFITIPTAVYLVNLFEKLCETYGW